MRQVWRHQLLFLACYLFWVSSVQAESSIDLIARFQEDYSESADQVDSWSQREVRANLNPEALNSSAFAIANYRTLEPLEPPLFRDGFEGDATVPDPVTITSFTASPSTISEGASTTLSWVTENADSCTPSGGTGGWSSVDIATAGLNSGSTVINASTQGEYTFTLTCLDADGGQAAMDTSLTVDPSCPTLDLSGTIVEWGNFWARSFPRPNYEEKTYTVPKFGYHAIRFNTGNALTVGTLTSIENLNTTGIILGAISRCPGDFDVEPVCDRVWGLGGGIEYSTTQEYRTCQLTDNTDYYFNVTFTDGIDFDESTCYSNYCVVQLEHSRE